MKRIEPQTEWGQKEKIKHAYEIDVARAIPGTSFEIDKENGRLRNLKLGECGLHIRYCERAHRFSFSIGGVDSCLVDENNCRKSFDIGDVYPRPASPDITVSADKSLEQIVKDFNRRFAPAYNRIVELLIIVRSRSDNYRCNTRDTAAQLADECGGKVSRQRGSYSEYNYVHFPGGSAEVRSADSIKFDFCVDNVEQAAQVAALLNKFKAEAKS